MRLTGGLFQNTLEAFMRTRPQMASLAVVEIYLRGLRGILGSTSAHSGTDLSCLSVAKAETPPLEGCEHLFVESSANSGTKQC